MQGVEVELYFEKNEWKRPHKEEVREQAFEIPRERVFKDLK